MKKLIALFLTLALLASLAGCAGTTVVVGNCTCPPNAHEPAPETTDAPAVDVPATDAPAVDVPETSGLLTGLAILPKISGSVAATAEENGKADYDVTIVAVTVDANGVIASCVIDSLGTSVAFDAAGAAVDFDPEKAVLTKNELGFDYGMVAYNASPIGKEWFEQAAALAEFAVGKTVDELKNGAIDESGYAADADLATSASINLFSYVYGIEAAVANAKDLGAQTGDVLKMAVNAKMAVTEAEAGGSTAELTLDVIALTLAGDVISSGIIDSLQAKVAFAADGSLATDVSVAPLTKNQLGFDYGMVAYNASAIGKEWFEQAEAFCTYITGKTAEEVASIAVTETTAPQADTDLAASCSIAIGGFQGLVAKACK